MKLEHGFYIEPRTSDKAHLSLNGAWDFCWEDSPVDDIKGLVFEHTANIPKATYFNLYEAGVLPHPYVGENSHEYRFVDQKIWYYRRKFEMKKYAKDCNAYLCFDGVGYFTRLWINGQLVGDHEGLFGGPIADVNQFLDFEHENELIVEIKSCNFGIADEEWRGIYRSPKNKNLVPWNMVKDSHTSNGDFTVMGIYRDVRIEFVDKMHLSRPYLVTKSVEKGKAVLHLSAEIATGEIDELQVPMNDVRGDAYVYGYVAGMNAVPDGRQVEIQIEFIEQKSGKTVYDQTFTKSLYDYSQIGIKSKYHECQFFEQDLELENPVLWNPVGLGDPELYTVNIALFHNGEKKDLHTFEFGIRTFEMDYTAGERMRTRWGKYQCVVNGKRFFLKGMNWTPLDFLLSSSEQDYRWALELAKKQNVQMIRVWGAGNAPEHDIFYKLCDRLGILVWQDSFLSNFDTPLWDKELFKFQQCMYIYRIRNHPSLVIHCSGNENNPYSVDNHNVWVWQRECEDLDPDRVQIRTTPDKGSAHVYRGFEPTWYRKMYTNLPFIGEAGTHTFPNIKTLRRLISKREFETPIDRFGSETMIRDYKELGNHVTEFDSWGLLKKIPAMSHMLDVKNVTVSDLCEATGMSSYEYYQFMVQAMREQYPVTGGILPWVYKRPWPTVAVQMLDGDADPVATYYAVKNAYSKVEIHLALKELVYAKEDMVELDVRIINESEEAVTGTAVTTIYSPDLKEVYKKTQTVTMAADQYQTAVNMGEFRIPAQWKDEYFFLHTALYGEDGEKISQSIYWPMVLTAMEDAEFKAARRTDNETVLTHEEGPWLMPQLRKLCDGRELIAQIEKLERSGDRITGVLRVQNSADLPVFPVKIIVLNEGMVQCLDDDSFWLEAGECRKIGFMIRNDMQSQEKISFSVRAWNTKEVIIEENA